LQIPEGVRVPVSHTGSVLDGATMLLDAFKRGVAAAQPPLEYRAPKHSPDIGAALYAARLSGTPLSI
jgi:hypothetical protein